AHRVADGWVFGLPELAPEQRQAIRSASRVTNTGCYPSAFLLLVRPLVEAGLLPADSTISIHALSGYTGGGKKLIDRWESAEAGLGSLPYEAPYALGGVHKHVAEMHRYSGLTHAPQFVPAVGPFACGMRVEVPIHAQILTPGTTADSVYELLHERYKNEPFVTVLDANGDGDERAFDPTSQNDSNCIVLHVAANSAGHLLLVGILDNLGKGASGTAIQCMNLMLDLGEETGLPK
ncbi:MAG: N-acetyl-gamma-glutamyl-phosphate reductase, partial [Chromatiales bacterium]|nr:N-acetyl-gamma-glutamyl-phosphate reductase [Chromatiales bacterium]